MIMSNTELKARIDAELARLRNLNPLERAQLDKLLAANAANLTDKVLGK